jgi:hypothetical protein
MKPSRRHSCRPLFASRFPVIQRLRPCFLPVINGRAQSFGHLRGRRSWLCRDPQSSSVTPARRWISIGIFAAFSPRTFSNVTAPRPRNARGATTACDSIRRKERRWILGGYRAIGPAQSGRNALLKRITPEDLDDKMPPPKSGNHLPPVEVAMLQAWIKRGPRYSRHWSYDSRLRPGLHGGRERHLKQRDFVECTVGRVQ